MTLAASLTGLSDLSHYRSRLSTWFSILKVMPENHRHLVFLRIANVLIWMGRHLPVKRSRSINLCQ